MHNGELYLPNDKELAKRQELLKEMFAEIGEGCYIEPPFHANFGGRHVHFGNHVYANFNLTAVDDTHIYSRRPYDDRAKRHAGICRTSRLA